MYIYPHRICWVYWHLHVHHFPDCDDHFDRSGEACTAVRSGDPESYTEGIRLCSWEVLPIQEGQLVGVDTSLGVEIFSRLAQSPQTSQWSCEEDDAVVL